MITTVEHVSCEAIGGGKSVKNVPDKARRKGRRRASVVEGNGREGQTLLGKPAVAPEENTPPDNPALERRQRRAWAPDGDDHLIYQWVKLDGKSQEHVAECFGISQSTVSRIVERYERWQAHAAQRDAGRLDPAERLRTQRWLAFERNEKMLLSCLRLAGEMEGCQDVSKSVTSHPQSRPSQETTVRTEWSVLDRTGMAARFLRLAFRINMEQVKLAEATPAPLPEPLGEEELAEQEAQAAEDRAAIEAVRERGQQELKATQVSLMDQLAAAQQELAEARREQESGARSREPGAATLTPALSQREREPGQADAGSVGNQECGKDLLHYVHKLHNEGGPKCDASAYAAEACAAAGVNRDFSKTSISIAVQGAERSTAGRPPPSP
jgi:hypothetical protein